MTAAATMRMRRFQLYRDEDETGTSGPGLVAEGCEFSSGMCALTWLTPFKTVSMWDSLKAVEIVHGHKGKTRVVWVDKEVVAVDRQHADVGDFYTFKHPDSSEYNLTLRVTKSNGSGPEDLVFFADGTHSKQRNLHPSMRAGTPLA